MGMGTGFGGFPQVLQSMQATQHRHVSLLGLVWGQCAQETDDFDKHIYAPSSPLTVVDAGSCANHQCMDMLHWLARGVVANTTVVATHV